MRFTWWHVAALLLAVAMVLPNQAALAANDRPLIYGMNPMPGEWAKHGADAATWEPLQFDAMQAAGCASVRVSVGWDLIEPNPGDRLWGDVDNDIRLHLDRGFEPVMLVVATPPWALLPDQLPPFYAPQPQFRAQFEKFVFDVARKFRGRVRYYEFWNEPNGYGWNRDPNGTTFNKAHEYVPWLIHGNAAIKRGDPIALWSIGGLDDNGGGGDDYLDKCYRYMAQSHFDAVCDHPYSNEIAQLGRLHDLRATMAEYGDALPVWITEMGWPANGREQTVADWITDYLMRLSSNEFDYCKIATYHTSVDFTAEPVGYGLMTYDLFKKAGYYAFQAMPKPTRVTLSGTPVIEALGPASVRISFSTDRQATAQIMYGPTTAYGNVTDRETTPTTYHQFVIDGLQPAASYRYRIRMGAGDYADNFSADLGFATSAGQVVGLVGTPVVSNVTTNSATICWTTSVACQSGVQYSNGYDYSNSVMDTATGVSHSVTLTGLEQDRCYQLRIVGYAGGFGNLIREIDPMLTRQTPGVLKNDGFEDPGSGQPWIVYGRCDGRFTAPSYFGYGARTGDCYFGSFSSWDGKTGGCYQEIGAIPGHVYQISAWTRSRQTPGTPGDDAARVGIDPTGGTDPYAASIVWGDWVWSEDQWAQMTCEVMAESDTITVYLDIRQPYAYQWNINTIDDVSVSEMGYTAMTLAEAKAAPAGATATVSGGVCTANFGDRVYVQAPDGTGALRVNGAFECAPGDPVSLWGTVSFTGPQKSIDAAAVSVAAGDGEAKPAGVVGRSIPGGALPGQTEVIDGATGVSLLNSWVKLWGRVTYAAEGYCYVDDGSGLDYGSGHAGIRVVFVDPTQLLAPDMIVSVWGIVEAEETGGVWRPVLRQVGMSDLELHKW